jgi:MoxR-like ATPase
MLKLKIGYPTKEEELKIMKRMAMTDKKVDASAIINPAEILKARKTVDEIYIDERIEKYIVDIVFATRDPKSYRLDELTALIKFGASPRASIHLSIASKAYAFLQGRGYVVPQDVKTVGMDVLRHRVIISYEAEAEDKTSEDIIKRVFEEVKVP